MNKSIAAVALWAAVCSLPLQAVETRFWTQDAEPDFERGKLTHLSLRSDGRLMLAPEFREMLDSSVPYLWALASDSKGNLYTAGGGPSSSTAKVYVIAPGGQSKALAELPGMEVHAIAVNRRDQVFAATSPDGKVYRIDAGGKAEEVYDPKAKYIWGLAFDASGNLYVATGDQGEVHRVTPDGKGSVFFKTEETHARSITVDAAGNLIIGTEPGGLIVRVSPAGEGFVLYQAPKREITAVAVAADGTIYATGVGNKGGAAAGPPPTLSVPPPQSPSTATTTTVVIPQAAAPKPGITTPTAPISPVSVAGGSELYRIEKDNYPRRMWSHPQDIAYAIGFDAQGRPIVGTGNKGNIYRIDAESISTLLINASPTQVTSLASGPRGALYAATGNIGRVYQIGPGIETQGSFESEPFDVGAFSYWGRLSHIEDLNGGSIAFDTRSGNLDRPATNWSPWAPLDAAKGSRVASPPARFLQYKLTMKAAPGGQSPEVRSIDIAYQTKNVAPAIDEIEATPPNYRFQTSTLNITPTSTISLPALGQVRRKSPAIPVEPASIGVTMLYAKGQVGTRWAAADANGDDLVFTVEIKGVGENEWKPLRDNVKERYLSWDSTAFPDGKYQVRVTASDSPSNPPGEALTAQLTSERFLIDNTPPAISNLTATRSGTKLTVRWTAADKLSILSDAAYSLNGADWVTVQPVSRLSDAQQLQYEVTIDGARQGENTVAVRVRDDYDNESVDKVVVR